MKIKKGSCHEGQLPFCYLWQQDKTTCRSNYTVVAILNLSYIQSAKPYFMPERSICTFRKGMGFRHIYCNASCC